ncbi:MAG: NAD(P)/FAD-dependent oxidoreductase [archaeon]|nr:NAD(P)/FAD-dependent oxidoreductase [archaeon]
MIQTDVVIIGSGPAGIQAAIQAVRKKVSVFVFGRAANSAMVGTHIENYFGLPNTMEGEKLIKNGINQAVSFGCKFFSETIIAASKNDDFFELVTESDEIVKTKAVVIATGISRKKLGVSGESEFFGKGVSYCASCDCNFYRGKTVAIVGDETEAAISAELMTKYASKVYWIINNISVSENLVNKAKVAGVELINGKVESIQGEKNVTSITVSGRIIKIDGVFIELGAKPATDIAMDIGIMPEMDDTIKVSADCSTKVKGVFACGDITGKPWQVAKAVGQGAIAGMSVADYVKGV